MSSPLDQRIAENVAEVRGRIAEAAARGGRSGDDVQLVAVSKYVGPDEARALVAAGCTVLGESRPQELWRKAEALSDLPVRWHQIGHLQRNKVRPTLPLVEMVQSVDSLRLLQSIDREAAPLGKPLPILLEVKVAGDAAKHGFAPDEVAQAIERAVGCPHVDVRGLMCMASFEGGLEAARRDFAALRALRDELKGRFGADASLDELSMGMSGDFEVAIEEGATIVRVGSLLFGGLR